MGKPTDQVNTLLLSRGDRVPCTNIYLNIMHKSTLTTSLRTHLVIAITACLISSCGGSGGSSDASAPGAISGDGVVADGIELPFIDSISVIVGSESDGDMIRFSPGSGLASQFSDLGRFDQFADFVGPMDIVGDTLISASDTNGLFGIDVNTGEVLWGTPLGRLTDGGGVDNPSAPVCVDNICYAMGNGGVLVAFDVTTQIKLWTNDLFPNVDDHLDVNPLLVVDDKIFAGGGRRNPSVFGDVIPQLFVVSRLTGEVESELEFGFPTLAGDLLMIRGQAPGLRAYHIDTMQPAWSVSARFVSVPALAGDVIVIHTSDVTVDASVGQRVVGINRNDGSLLWVREAGTLQSFLDPVSDGQVIYSHFAQTCRTFLCVSAYPRALNPIDGSIIWENKDFDSVSVAPVVLNGQLLYDEASSGGGSSRLRGSALLNTADGSAQWVSLNGHTAFESITAIIDGKAYRSGAHPTFESRR